MLRQILSVALLVAPAAAAAQSTGPAAAVEFAAGHAAFVDDASIGHSVWGGAGRVYVGRRLSVGPEVVYMRGPRSDRDLFLTGNVTIDLLGDRGRESRVIPFIVAGAGLMRHSDRFGTETFSSSEGTFTAGAGLRGTFTDRVFAGGDVRIGWELHTRVAGFVGVRLGS